MKEDFTFVRQCILSSKNEWQIECCQSLIKLFLRKHVYELNVMDDFFCLTDEMVKKQKELKPV